MKTMQNIDIRLTDALERQLLQEAIESEHTFAFDRAVKQMFQTITSFFKAPKAHAHHSIRTAH